MYTVYLWLVGKRVVDFLLLVIELFHQLSRLRRCERNLVKIVVFERGVGHFERKFRREGSSTDDSWPSPCAVTWYCLRDLTFSRFDTIPACDRQTDRHTHTRTHTYTHDNG